MKFNLKMNKKNLIKIGLLLATTIIIAVAVYFGYRYYIEGTPGYSLKQLQTALKADSPSGAEHYMDMDSITGKLWPRSVLELQAKSGSDYNAVNSAIISSQEKEFISMLKTTFYDAIRDPAHPNGLTSVINQLELLENGKFIITGDTASLAMTDKDSGYNIKFVFAKQSDRAWKMTDIEGLEDVVFRNIGN